MSITTDFDEAGEIIYHTEEEYYALPDERRVELIDGIFYDMASPNVRHQDILMELSSIIRLHIKAKGGPCKVFPAPLDVKLFPDEDGNIVEPDIIVVCDPSKIKTNRIEGAPDWLIEIVSPGNPEHDYWRKLNLYQDAGVKEYWIVDPQKRTVTVHLLQKNKYQTTIYSFRDKVTPAIYEDLTIDFAQIEGFVM